MDPTAWHFGLLLVRLRRIESRGDGLDGRRSTIVAWLREASWHSRCIRRFHPAAMLRSVVSWGGIAVPRVARLELGGVSRERRCERESCCPISSGSPVHGLGCSVAGRKVVGQEEGIMRGTYQGLPPARNVEEAIVLAQLLIKRDLERRTTLETPEDQLSPNHHADGLNAA